MITAQQAKELTIAALQDLSRQQKADDQLVLGIVGPELEKRIDAAVMANGAYFTWASVKIDDLPALITSHGSSRSQAAIARVARRMLEDAGYTIDEVSSGHQTIFFEWLTPVAQEDALKPDPIKEPATP